MAKLIPDLNDCYSSMTSGEQKVAEVLRHHLNKDCLIWINPQIPPENLEPDFIVLDPGRGLIVIEVKDWKLDTIGQAGANFVTLIKIEGNSEAKNPYRQAKTYIYAVIDRLKQQKTLVYPQGHPRQGQLLFPYIPEVILTNITRNELKQKQLEEVFGSRSVFCSDEIVKNVDSETFIERLWHPRQFSLSTRLTSEQIGSVCASLCLENPLILKEVLKDKPNISKNNNTKLNVITLSPINLSDVRSDEIINILPVPQPVEDGQASSHNSIKPTQELTETKIVIPLPTDSSSNDLKGKISVPPIPKDTEIEIKRSGSIPTPKLPSVKRQLPLWAIGSGLLIVLGIGAKSIPYLLHPKLQVSSITIDTLGSPEYQADLAEYLKEQLVPNNFWQYLQSKKIKVVIDGDKSLPYQEAERRIANKEWDIAFTLSPVISVAAKDNGYTFAAKMFPKSKGYQSALFVKAESLIKSIDDIKPTTTIALGSANSASSFYMPSYDLYRKSVIVDMGHRGSKILELVKIGRADVGAAALGDMIKAADPNIRIIHQSRDIPSSGVYLSSKLSEIDRSTIKKLLLDAPPDIQKQANYALGTEPDYSFFREIIGKAESIQICSDLTKNPVNLFCADSFKPITITGKINGWSNKSNTRVLNLRENSGKTYHITISPQVLAEAIGNSEPIGIQGKEVQIKPSSMPQEQADGTFELKITQARQLKIMATFSDSTPNQAL